MKFSVTTNTVSRAERFRPLKAGGGLKSPTPLQEL